MVLDLNQKIDYSQFVSNLNESGLKTTHISEKEANFSMYGNALSDQLQNEILSSFDRPEDYEIQLNLAAAFKGKNTNYMQSGNFMSACRKLGYTVNLEYRSTSYISDYKAGNFSNKVRNGSIGVYTISDGKGGEIVIVDSNGNGALEIEEVFMNNILGDVMKEINVPTVDVSGIGSSSSSSGLSLKDNASTLVTQSDYNNKVEAYLDRGLSLRSAENKAKSELNVSNFTYTGAAEIDEEQEEIYA